MSAAKTSDEIANSPRKPYQTPRMVRYGKLQDLTRGGAGNLADGTMGSRTGVCWIAEALYGTADPRTHLLRAWLNGPYAETRWGGAVMALYRAVGREVAWAARQGAPLRACLRPWFEAGLRRAQRHYMQAE